MAKLFQPHGLCCNANANANANAMQVATSNATRYITGRVHVATVLNRWGDARIREGLRGSLEDFEVWPICRR